MGKRLLTRSEVFFPNPIIVMVEYPSSNFDESNNNWLKLTRKIYKTTTGTWGYSAIAFEITKTTDQADLSYLFDNTISKYRGYICFQHEEDELQARLSSDGLMKRVKMWPSKTKFTIHEYTED